MLLLWLIDWMNELTMPHKFMLLITLLKRLLIDWLKWLPLK
ncbi:hypothetical protein [Alkalihalobacillus sp. R86527]